MLPLLHRGGLGTISMLMRRRPIQEQTVGGNNCGRQGYVSTSNKATGERVLWSRNDDGSPPRKAGAASLDLLACRPIEACKVSPYCLASSVDWWGSERWDSAPKSKGSSKVAENPRWSSFRSSGTPSHHSNPSYGSIQPSRSQWLLWNKPALLFSLSRPPPHPPGLRNQCAVPFFSSHRVFLASNPNPNSFFSSFEP